MRRDSRPTFQFSNRKDQRLAKVAAYRNKRLDALTVTVGGKTFPADPRTAAYIVLIQASVNAGNSLPAGFSVRTVNGVKFDADASTLTQYSAEIAKAQYQTINDVWNKVDLIKAAQDAGELEAVALET